MASRQETTVEDVRARSDIVEVVSEFVRLRKAGRNFKGLCPFHKERTPSFMVNPERQMFHCFGCGEGGDVFSFVMAHEKLEFPEALRYLAERAGLPLPHPRGPKKSSEFEVIYRANEFAARFYHERLKSGEGRRALAYLERRGLNPEMIGSFQIGAAPAGGASFLDAARRQGFSPEDLAKAGLAGKGDSGQWYGRFRNRIMFPICDVGGRVVGLGGRLLGDGEPKYLNSPETRVFRKGTQLYGLNWSRREIGREDRVLVVEGYLDFIALKQFGVENAVATMGTALAREAARKLSRYTRRVTVVNDGDEAGKKAAVRSSEVLLAEGFRVHVALLPEGDDPDSFVRSRGTEAFREIVREAPGIVHFLFRDAKGYEARERATRVALELFSQIEDPIRRGWYVKELAERAGLDEEMLQRAAQAKTGLPRSETRRSRSPAVAGAVQAERGILKYLLDAELVDSDVLERVRSVEFRDPPARRVMGVLLEALDRGERLTESNIVSLLEDREARALVAALSFKDDIVDEGKQVRDYLHCLRRRELKDRISEAKFEMREAERQGDEEALRRSQTRYLDLVSELKQQSS